MISIIDVSSDANGSFGNQTLFASFLATHIVKNTFSIGDHYIRNNLFKIRIGFSEGTRHEIVILLIKDDWQIAVNLGTEALKNTQLLKKRAGKNENIFVCNSHNQSRIQKLEFRSQNLASIKFSPG